MPSRSSVINNCSPTSNFRSAGSHQAFKAFHDLALFNSGPLLITALIKLVETGSTPAWQPARTLGCARFELYSCSAQIAPAGRTPRLLRLPGSFRTPPGWVVPIARSVPRSAIAGGDVLRQRTGILSDGSRPEEQRSTRRRLHSFANPSRRPELARAVVVPGSPLRGSGDPGGPRALRMLLPCHGRGLTESDPSSPSASLM